MKHQTTGPSITEASAQIGVSYQRIGQIVKERNMRTRRIKREQPVEVICIDPGDWKKYLESRKA